MSTIQNWSPAQTNQTSEITSINPLLPTSSIVFPYSLVKNSRNQEEAFNKSFAGNYSKEGGDNYYYGFPIVLCFSIAIVIFMVLAIVGNTMVILTVAKHSGMRTRTNMFIVNLAVADILTALIDMPISLTTVLSGGWIFGHSFCHFNGFTLPLFLISSIHTLMYISIHKYVSITRPFSKSMTPTRILIMIAAAWSWAFFCAMAPLLGWNKIVYKKGASQCGPSIPDDWLERSHSVMITTSNYIIPLSVMIFCYCHIFREIEEHMGRMRETSSVDLKNTLDQQKRISFTLFLVLACFLVCWTPFVAYSSTLAFIKDKSKMPLIANPVAYWCGYLNSACNPIIYALRSPSFRQGYKEIMFGEKHQYAFNGGRQSYSARSSQCITGPLTIAGGIRKKLLGEMNWNSLPILPSARKSTPSSLHLSNSLPPAKSKQILALQAGSAGDECTVENHSDSRPRLFPRSAQSLPVTPRHESFCPAQASNLICPSVLDDFSASKDDEAVRVSGSGVRNVTLQEPSSDYTPAPMKEGGTTMNDILRDVQGQTPEKTVSEDGVEKEVPTTRRPSAWIVNFLPSLCFRTSPSTYNVADLSPANLVRSMSVEVLHCPTRRPQDALSRHSVLQRKYQSFPPTYFRTKWLLNFNRRRHKHKGTGSQPAKKTHEESTESEL